MNLAICTKCGIRNNARLLSTACTAGQSFATYAEYKEYLATTPERHSWKRLPQCRAQYGSDRCGLEAGHSGMHEKHGLYSKSMWGGTIPTLDELVDPFKRALWVLKETTE